MTSIRVFCEGHDAITLWLSDSSRLSDNLSQQHIRWLSERLSFCLLVIILILSEFYCQQGENMSVYKHLPPWIKGRK